MTFVQKSTTTKVDSKRKRKTKTLLYEPAKGITNCQQKSAYAVHNEESLKSIQKNSKNKQVTSEKALSFYSELAGDGNLCTTVDQFFSSTSEEGTPPANLTHGSWAAIDNIQCISIGQKNKRKRQQTHKQHQQQPLTSTLKSKVQIIDL